MTHGHYLRDDTGAVLGFLEHQQLFSFEQFAAWVVRQAPPNWSNVRLEPSTDGVLGTLLWSDESNRLCAITAVYSVVALGASNRVNAPAANGLFLNTIMARAEYVTGRLAPGEAQTALMLEARRLAAVVHPSRDGTALEVVIARVLELSAEVATLSSQLEKLESEVRQNEYSRSITNS